MLDITNDIKLPVLKDVVLATQSSANFQNVVFVCAQHFLHTTVDLIESLIALGAHPKNIYLIGKIYSRSDSVANTLSQLGNRVYKSSYPKISGYFEESFISDVEAMWEDVMSNLPADIRGIIILDDGGTVISTAPLNSITVPVIGVEQTSSGACRLHADKKPLMTVDVAFSAAKQLLESPFIADALCLKLNGTLSLCNPSAVYGVAGMGVIGRAVVNKLTSLGWKVVVYDPDEAQLAHVNDYERAIDINQLVSKVDYVFGCSGKDITTKLDLTLIDKNKAFISCSSQDVEFRTLLRAISAEYTHSLTSFHNIKFGLKEGVVLEIVKRGYPVNFDLSGESVPAENIQMTRGLLLGGCLQAASYLPSAPAEYVDCMLLPSIQSFVVNSWTRNKMNPPVQTRSFCDLEWIQQNSRGTIMPSILNSAFCSL